MSKGVLGVSKSVLIAVVVTVIVYSTLVSAADVAVALCINDSAEVVTDCALELAVSAAGGAGLAIAVAMLGWRGLKRDLKSPPLDRATYNVDTGALTLIFNKPITRLNRCGPILVHSEGARMENGNALDLGESTTYTAGSGCVRRTLEFTVSDDACDQIRRNLGNGCIAPFMLEIRPRTIYLVGITLSDITSLNGGEPVRVTDIDIIRETQDVP